MGIENLCWACPAMNFNQNPAISLSLARRIIIFILGLTDCLLFGGASFGWPHLVYLLKKDRVYSDLCDVSNIGSLESSPYRANVTTLNITQSFTIDRCSVQLTTIREGPVCSLQDDRFALIFTIAVLCFGLPGVAIGYLLHYAGLRITRIMGGLMIAASFICLSLTTKESPHWLFPSMILLSWGGNQLRMSSMQFGDLFPRFRSTAITVLSGIYAASASLFLVFSIMEDVGISRIFVCYFFAGWAFISSMLSFIMPFHHIPCEGETDLKQTDAQMQMLKREVIPLKTSLITLSSFLHQYWFFICLFTINLYQQNYNIWVTASSCNDDETKKFSMWFSYSNLLSVFSAPIGGMFTDYMIRKAKSRAINEREFGVKTVQASFVPLLVSTLCSIGMYCCILFFNPTAIIVSLAFMIFVRPCVVALSTVYLRNRFPGEHFNRLLGVYCTFATIIMCLQYPHFHWAQSAYYLVHGITFGFLILSLSNPLHLLSTKYVAKFFTEFQPESEIRNLKNLSDRDSPDNTPITGSKS